jgi:nucleoside-diphosphate-sugar epimerase
MKVLVTGGAGYVGNLLCKALLDRGHRVTIVDNFLYGYGPILDVVGNPNLDVVKSDIRNPDRSYLKGQDVVFHLAAISGYPACEANPHSAQLINIEATREIVGAMDPGQLLIFASTTSLYGDSGTRCTEDTPVAPRGNLYAQTKVDGEGIVMERANSISLRWSTVFGVSPRMRMGLILNDFVNRAVNEHAVVVYSGQSKRAFIHVLDAVQGYLFMLDNAARASGEIFNMGSNKLTYSKIDLTTMIAKHVDFEIIESHIADADIRDYLVSFDKAAGLGYDCSISVEEGVAELFKLFKFYTPNAPFQPI